MVARFLGRELAGLDHVSHQAVIARELLELALVQQIGARVADLRDEQAFPFEHAGGHGGSHALAPASVAAGADDLAVRFLDGGLQSLPVGVLGRHFGQDVHGDFRCHLARGVTAHAVGDGEQRRAHHQAVLVVVAHAADVGSAAERRDGAFARALG